MATDNMSYSASRKTGSYRDLRDSGAAFHGRTNTPPLHNHATGSRKRSRADTADFVTDSRYTTKSGWADLAASVDSIGPASPPPLSNSSYRLAGGVDTPTREAASQFEHFGGKFESDVRRRWTTSTRDGDNGGHTIIVGALDRESNGRGRGQLVEEAEQPSWGQFVIGAVTGAVGKVWNFCTAGAFRGFVAGGGDGYIMTDSGLSRTSSGSTLRGNKRSFSTSKPIPGQFPEEPDDHYDRREHARPAKRLQTTREDWVMVESPRPYSNSRSVSGVQASPNFRSHATRASIRATPVRRPRASIARVGSASLTGSPHVTSSHKRAASVATAGSPAASPSTQRSPAAIIEEDVQRYSAKRKRETKHMDASMRRLNDQLQMMIQQGKAALNSTVEVELDEGLDGGPSCEYDEGDFVDGESDPETPRKRW